MKKDGNTAHLPPSFSICHLSWGALSLIKIAVIDDVCSDRLLLLDYIARYGKERRVLIETKDFESGEEFLTSFERSAYSIIFLDIYMNGLSGMETARKIREQDAQCLLVFSTASSRHAVESYRVRASDYLLKPYDYAAFSEAFSLCDRALLSRSRYIEVRESRIQQKIFLRDILYIDYYKHYVQIHTKTRTVRSYMPFSEISQSLAPYTQFLCCYRNLMINLDAVETLEDKDFLLNSSERIPIARARRTGIRQAYADYVLNKLDSPDTPDMPDMPDTPDRDL